MKPKCPNCKSADKVSPNGWLAGSKQAGPRKRWVCKSGQKNCKSWSELIDPDYARFAALRALNGKYIKAISMWVSGVSTKDINVELSDGPEICDEYEKYQARVLKIYKAGLWEEMKKSVVEKYPLTTREGFDDLLADCQDWIAGKRRFRRMISKQRKFNSLPLTHQNKILARWNEFYEAVN